MDLSLVLSESIDIKAPAAKVWRGLTDPAIIKEYLYGTNTQTTWEIGTEVVFEGEFDGKSYRDKGVVLENEPGSLLSYTYWSGFSGMEDKPENYSIVTCRVIPLDEEHTRLTWTHRGYASKEAYEHSKIGMKPFMESIKTVMERA